MRNESNRVVLSVGRGVYTGVLGRTLLHTKPDQLELPSESSKPKIEPDGVSCGLFHSIVYDSSTPGALFTFGRSTVGRLGLGASIALSEQPVYFPQAVVALSSERIVSASAGGLHSAFVSFDGKLFTSGFAGFGALAHGRSLTEDVYIPTVASFTEHAADVACGGSHTLVRTLNGTLFSCGRADHGRLGLGLEAVEAADDDVSGSVSSLTQVDLGNEHAKQIACGGFASACITASGKLLTWGGNLHGELGRYSNASAPCELPGQVHHLPGHDPPVQVAVGGFHSLCLLASGRVVAFGYGKEGALGNMETRSSVLPVEMHLPASFNGVAAHVSAGPKSSQVVSASGEVAVCGRNMERQLGLPDDSPAAERDYVVCLQPLQLPHDGKLRALPACSAGAEHMLFTATHNA